MFPLGFAVIGLMLGLRRPGNPIGWLYAASGLAWSLVVPLQPWVDGLLRDHQALPLAAQVGVVLEDVVWGPAVTLGVTLPALLVPDGRLPSRRWRVLAAAAVAGTAMAVVGDGLAPGRLSERPIANPFGLAGVPGTVAAVVGDAGSVLWLVGLVAALISLVLRFRAARGLERQQRRWVLAVAAATLAAAAQFAPLRRRVQQLVDRRFNRARYDAARTVAGFAARLREQVDLDALVAELQAVVDQTVQPTAAWLWLRPPSSPQPPR